MNTITFKYIGRTYKNCKPSPGQQQALASDQNWQSTVKSSYGDVFGKATAMYNKLDAGLTAIADSQSAYSAPVLASMNAQTLNTAAANAAKVDAAIGRNATRGSVTPGVESGIEQAEKAGAKTEILSNMANEQAGITQKNAELTIQERDRANAQLANLGNVFNPSTEIAGQETGAEKVTQDQANTNAAASKQWIGVLGGLADAAVGGLTGRLTGGVSAATKSFAGANSVGTWNGGTPGGESGMSDVSAGAFGEGSGPWNPNQ